MGEIVQIDNKQVEVRTPKMLKQPDQILVRDAFRNRKGLLVTAKPMGKIAMGFTPPPDVMPYVGSDKFLGPLPVVREGGYTATLVNGVFGDPLLHVRLHNQKRSLLFDIGEGGRLPARLAHQITDVFISHCHIDHISGFLWLMRSRIGVLPACRMYGPPGLAGHVGSLMDGIHWDRIGELGPRFTVCELHGKEICCYALQAGLAVENNKTVQPLEDGLLLNEPGLKVRAVKLDHGEIPVLAYSLEQPPRLNVDKERLAARKLSSGPWLAELKRMIAAGKREALIRLSDGSKLAAGMLADDFIVSTTATKLVYATDLADSTDNRKKLIGLAHKANTFFCEAAFVEADNANANRSGHLTARACGEIAQTADVYHLVPFHFSRRYEKEMFKVYDEVKTAFPKVILPVLISNDVN